jgi:DNA-binding LacI/PurR family transcriptional regulator
VDPRSVSFHRLALRKRARLADIAVAAGVSRTVVGQVLNGGAGNSRVAEETASRIREVARRLDYRPNLAARQLRGKRTQTYGLLVASAGDPLRSFLVQYLDMEASKVGCHTIIGNTIGRDEPNNFGYYVDEFARRGVDGVFCAVHDWFSGNRKELVAQHPNTVFYGRPTQVSSAHYVDVDRAGAVRLAVRHLIERGRRRIGIALAGLSKSTCRARLKGYRTELAAHGVSVDERLIFDGVAFGQIFAQHNETSLRWDYPAEVVEHCIDKLVAVEGVDSIVAHDDFWAATLLRFARGRGIRVPDDLAVVGYLNHYLADWTDPPLTTVDLQHAVAAKAMVALMERLINGGPLPASQREVKIEPKLIVRGSSLVSVVD